MKSFQRHHQPHYQYEFREEDDPSDLDKEIPIEFKTRQHTLTESIHRQESTSNVDAARASISDENEVVIQTDLHADLSVDYHVIPSEDLFARLGVTSQGLSTQQAMARKNEFGPNAIIPFKPNRFIKALKTLFSGFGVILWPAAVLAILPGDPLEIHQIPPILDLESSFCLSFSVLLDSMPTRATLPPR